MCMRDNGPTKYITHISLDGANPTTPEWSRDSEHPTSLTTAAPDRERYLAKIGARIIPYRQQPVHFERSR